MSPFAIILASWLVFIIVWVISALKVKRDIRGGAATLWSRFWMFRALFIGIVVFLIIRYVDGAAVHQGVAAHLFYAPPPLIVWFGAALCPLGIGWAIWARYHLGRNWSGNPAIKAGHELITTGPYATLRHPIYTGMILAMSGAALAGYLFGLIMFVLFAIIFIARIPTEERYMLELFPDAYPSYRARTKRLIPFVW